MLEFITNELRYPEKALKNNIEGLVVVKIDINDRGEVVRTKIKKSIGHGCDEEAVRIVKLLKFYVTKMRKVRLTHHKTIKINFKIPIKKVQAEKKSKNQASISSAISQPMEIVYNYVPTKKN